ncbi:hypothetical protein NPIL_55661 [Nephila pilipes]|uniref:Uncharacterized protein n=1 Tax=Nephila pilipes TaxID=299642 RepID=A0A8X6QIV3_NEPPI|nr:hypothetical protein NPIL_55661 [Nephila pilipes]
MFACLLENDWEILEWVPLIELLEKEFVLEAVCSPSIRALLPAGIVLSLAFISAHCLGSYLVCFSRSIPLAIERQLLIGLLRKDASIASSRTKSILQL